MNKIPWGTSARVLYHPASLDAQLRWSDYLLLAHQHLGRYTRPRDQYDSLKLVPFFFSFFFLNFVSNIDPVPLVAPLSGDKKKGNRCRRLTKVPLLVFYRPRDKTQCRPGETRLVVSSMIFKKATTRSSSGGSRWSCCSRLRELGRRHRVRQGRRLPSGARALLQKPSQSQIFIGNSPCCPSWSRKEREWRRRETLVLADTSSFRATPSLILHWRV